MEEGWTPTLEDVQLALGEASTERDKRLKKLFDHFDTKSDGAVDRDQLEEGFKKLEIPSRNKFARELLEACDMNHDGKCEYKEFRSYMDNKEVELYSLFREIDLKNDGVVEPSDLESALHKAGIDLAQDELLKFVDRMDQDHNGVISFSEWRDFLMLLPGRVTMASIYQYWEKECQVDIGEQSVIPEGIKKRHVDTWKYFVAGGVSGAVSRTITAPLDRLKVLLQVQTGGVLEGSGERPKISRSSPGILRGVSQMYRNGGILGLFRGNGVNVVKVAPESAIKFFAYETLKNAIRGDGSNGDIGLLGRLTAGGVAGAIAQTLIYPLDLLKTRLQTHPGGQNGSPPSFPRLAAEIFRDGGFRAFYRGLTPTLIGVVPYAGLDLAAYETLKEFSRKLLPEGQDPGPLIQLTCGTISGAFGASVVYPLNVIRTRMQAQRADSAVQYRGMGDVVSRTLRGEGLGGFYRGLSVNLLKVAPAASITYITYEEMKRRLGI